MSKPVAEWTSADVASWVVNLPDMEPEDGEIFKKNRVNGRSLLHLAKDDLQKLGFPTGVVVLLDIEISKLKIDSEKGSPSKPPNSSPAPSKAVSPSGFARTSSSTSPAPNKNASPATKSVPVAPVKPAAATSTPVPVISSSNHDNLHLVSLHNAKYANGSSKFGMNERYNYVRVPDDYSLNEFYQVSSGPNNEKYCTIFRRTTDESASVISEFEVPQKNPDRVKVIYDVDFSDKLAVFLTEKQEGSFIYYYDKYSGSKVSGFQCYSSDNAGNVNKCAFIGENKIITHVSDSTKGFGIQIREISNNKPIGWGKSHEIDTSEDNNGRTLLTNKFMPNMVYVSTKDACRLYDIRTSLDTPTQTLNYQYAAPVISPGYNGGPVLTLLLSGRRGTSLTQVFDSRKSTPLFKIPDQYAGDYGAISKNAIFQRRRSCDPCYIFDMTADMTSPTSTISDSRETPTHIAVAADDMFLYMGKAAYKLE